MLNTYRLAVQQRGYPLIRKRFNHPQGLFIAAAANALTDFMIGSFAGTIDRKTDYHLTRNTSFTGEGWEFDGFGHIFETFGRTTYK